MAIVIGVAGYTFRDKFKKAYVYVFGDNGAAAAADPANRHAVFADDQCSICL